MSISKRICVQPVKPYEDLSIRYQYEIQKAEWINHPDVSSQEDSFLEYKLEFKLEQDEKVIIHVSADQRFELFCDGHYIGMGPDRSDLQRWSFHSYTIELPAGKHELNVLVYYIVTNMPNAQVTHRPGFIIASESMPAAINSGTASWVVRKMSHITPIHSESIKSFHAVGPDYRIDENMRNIDKNTFVDAVSVSVGGNDTIFGSFPEGWRLFPSYLPEQLRRPVSVGKVRMVVPYSDTLKFEEITEEKNRVWQDLIDQKSCLTIPPRSHTVVLWDLENYYCAYPELVLSDGKDASVKIDWAEACFLEVNNGKDQPTYVKNNRNEINGRIFIGYGDTCVSDGGGNRRFISPWWRAGRFVRLIVKTEKTSLTIESMRLLETRLPLENESEFQCSDEDIHKFIPIAVRGIQMCAHETYMDCPYYEQMMYVGDTRPQILTAYIMNRENRLNKRALELFDWSRHVTGFVLERHPSTPRQLSTTFSMVWILMLRDFAWWKNDTDFIKERLPGMRSLLECFKAHQGDGELLTGLPGWSFIDWVPEWDNGCAPDGEFGTSAVNNLLFLFALKYASDVEKAYGEEHLATYNLGWGRKLAGKIKEKFWDEERGVFADDLAHSCWSEHSQSLALLSGMFDKATSEKCFQSLITADNLCRTTVYFSFYLLETLNLYNRGDLILEKMNFWKELHNQGFKTPVEFPEPSRSDCHAWGSHPLFHLHASVAGIRPAVPGFKEVSISPKPGFLTLLESKIPHPEGEIWLRMSRKNDSWRVNVSLPEGVPSTFEYKKTKMKLTGDTEFDFEVV